MSQVWSVAAYGAYLYSDELSDVLRMALQPVTRFRDCCDVEEAKGLNRGDAWNWNTFGNVETEGDELQEDQPIPETRFSIGKTSLTVTEFGNSIPYSQKLNNFSKQPLTRIINKTLRHDAAKSLDKKAHAQFNLCKLRVAPTGGTSTTEVTLSTNGSTAITNDAALGFDHVKAISDIMVDRDIPAYDGEDYLCLARQTTLRPILNDLEDIHKYVDQGWKRIMNGEKGRADSVRFVSQTNVASEAWTNGDSDAAFFMGADTVTEAIVIPEEIRAKIGQDYGRDQGVAWYAVLGFGLSHTDADNGRIIKWDSAA